MISSNQQIWNSIIVLIQTLKLDEQQFRASKINMALARMDKLVKKLMSNPVIYSWQMVEKGIKHWNSHMNMYAVSYDKFKSTNLKFNYCFNSNIKTRWTKIVKTYYWQSVFV
jgi:hypothetical protein